MADYYSNNIKTCANYKDFILTDEFKQHFPSEGLYIGNLRGNQVDMPPLVDLSNINGLCFLYNNDDSRNKANCCLELSMMSRQTILLKNYRKKLDEIDEELRRDLERTDDGESSKRDDIKRSSAKSKFSAITNVVVPNSRADLLELMAFAKPKADKAAKKRGFELNGGKFKSESLGYAYWTLYGNCIDMAKANFQDDSAFQYYFKDYEKKNRLSLSYIATKIGGTIDPEWAWIIIIFLSLILICFIGDIGEKRGWW